MKIQTKHTLKFSIQDLEKTQNFFPTKGFSIVMNTQYSINAKIMVIKMSRVFSFFYFLKLNIINR